MISFSFIKNCDLKWFGFRMPTGWSFHLQQHFSEKSKTNTAVIEIRKGGKTNTIILASADPSAMEYVSMESSFQNNQYASFE